MSRTAIVIALAVAAATGLLFGIHPQLDLEISARFFDATGPGFVTGRTAAGGLSWAGLCRDAATWIVTALSAPAGVALVLKLLAPSTRLVMPARAIVFLMSTLALGPGLMTNVILKEHWGRPRPVDVRPFGGGGAFVAWWDPRGACAHNCSFVAGEGSGAFWALAPAALAPPRLRPLAYAAALSFGVAAGALRIAFGGHFFTDVVFSGVLTFIVIWVMHGVLYRWPRPALSDVAIEAALARPVLSIHAICHDAVARLGVLVRRLSRHVGA